MASYSHGWKKKRNSVGSLLGSVYILLQYMKTRHILHVFCSIAHVAVMWKTLCGLWSNLHEEHNIYFKSPTGRERINVLFGKKKQ